MEKELTNFISTVYKHFISTVYKARRKSETSFPHSFLAIFPLLEMQLISSFILKKGCFERNWLLFFNRVP